MEHIIWTIGHQLKFKNIVNSDNCFIYDSDGNRYVDLESGVWCTSVGHNNKRINGVITSQINKISHIGFCYCNPQIEETSKKILEITNIIDGKCEFLCSGSESVEFGMRVARSVTEKQIALTFSDSYFGAYGDAAVKNKENWYLFNWLNCSCGDNENGCTGECDDFNNIPFEKIGIFLFEPGSSSGFVRFPSKLLINKIIERIKEGKGVVMINEVTTGIGRTGKWFGYQHYNIVPDIVAIGKGIGNGYPVGITAISEDIAAKLSAKNFLYSQSHQNDPLGAIIANEVIHIIDDDKLLAKSKKMGKYIIDRLLILKKEYSIIKDVRGRGLMISIEFERDSLLIYEDLLKKGFILCKRSNSEVLRLDPALSIGVAEIEMFINSFKEIIRKF